MPIKESLAGALAMVLVLGIAATAGAEVAVQTEGVVQIIGKGALGTNAAVPREVQGAGA